MLDTSIYHTPHGDLQDEEKRFLELRKIGQISVHLHPHDIYLSSDLLFVSILVMHALTNTRNNAHHVHTQLKSDLATMATVCQVQPHAGSPPSDIIFRQSTRVVRR